MGLEKTRIQNKLIEILQEGPFYGVSYDSTTRLLTVGDGSAVTPSSVAVQETRAIFDVSERNRQTFRRDRTTWQWLAIVKFENEVSSEEFEQIVLADPPTLESDSSEGLRAVRLDFLNADYRHPPQQQSSNGSQIEYEIQAVLYPE